MAGRAGRAGLDTVGESFLLMPEERSAKAPLLTKETLRQLMREPPKALTSSLAVEGGLRRLMLEGVFSGQIATATDAKRFCLCTLLAHLSDFQQVA
eukprot:3307437-Pyramimonas_sp.AAC.2